jgi:hypothetical protein
MKPFSQRWSGTTAPVIRNWWIRHHTTVLRFAIAVMVILALLKLGTEFWRLLLDSGPKGAIDLKPIHKIINHWFAGKPVYSESAKAVYPPASYVILWPFLGWLELTPARWLWAITTVGALGWFVYLLLKESRADTSLERAFVALMLLSMNATGVTIGNAQRILHLLPMLLTGLFLLYREKGKWYGDLLSAGLILVSLVSPPISAPFFWMAVFIPRTLRPAIFVSLGYAALTIFALSFQGWNFLELLSGSIKRGLGGIEWGSKGGGYANLHTLLIHLDMKEWILPASLIVLAALGLWVYFYRDADRWLLLGVTALVARFWTYHRLYDNLLILLPMIALFRIVKQGPSVNGEDITAGLLLGITTLIMLAPARLLIAPSPWDELFKALQVIIWMAILIFLLHQTWEEKKKKIKPFSVNMT